MAQAPEGRVDAFETLARELTARVAAIAPDWTDRTDGDPGVTLLELAAFLAESLDARANTTPQDRARLQAVAARLQRLTEGPCRDATLSRVHYFHGMVLGADDFEQEQQYFRARARRHNRLLHGVGIVRGLEVGLRASPDGDPMVVVSPGMAISPEGEELVLCDPVSVPPCPDGPPCFVCLRLVERPAGVLPGGEPSRIEELTEVVVRGDAPDGCLVIARLVRDGGSWRVDASFARPGAAG